MDCAYGGSERIVGAVGALCASDCVVVAFQLGAVVAFEGFREFVQEIDELGDRLDGEVERQTDEGLVVGLEHDV